MEKALRAEPVAAHAVARADDPEQQSLLLKSDARRQMPRFSPRLMVGLVVVAAVCGIASTHIGPQPGRRARRAPATRTAPRRRPASGGSSRRTRARASSPPAARRRTAAARTTRRRRRAAAAAATASAAATTRRRAASAAAKAPLEEFEIDLAGHPAVRDTSPTTA